MSETLTMQGRGRSQRPLAPWAVPLAAGIFVVLGVASVWLSQYLHDAVYLAGLTAAVTGAGGALLWGLRLPSPWPRWANRVAGTLLLAGAAVTAVTGVLAAAGIVTNSSTFLPLALVPNLVPIGPALIFMGAGWVYMDARRRGLNARLWALLSVLLFPYLIGFIIYVVMVLVRDQRMSVCPRCSARMGVNLAFCTACGEQLQRACAQCGGKILPGSAFCGGCGAPVERN